MSRNRLQQIEYVFASISELGLEVHPASRLAVLKRIFEEIPSFPGGKMTSDHPEFNVALECVRDFSILSDVFDAIPKPCRDAKFVDILKRVLGGQVLPNEQKQNSPERDFEYELYIFAGCHGANLSPVTLEEPDICCSFQGKKLAIAAKRIKSENKFIDRIDQAADQIQKSGNSGIIMADITSALDPNNERVSFEPLLAESITRYRTGLDAFVNHYKRQIGQCIGDRKIIAIILHFNVVNLVPDGVWSLVWMNYLITLDEGKKHYRAETFHKRFSEGGSGVKKDFRLRVSKRPEQKNQFTPFRGE